MNNFSQNRETSYNDNANETGERNQPSFAKKAAAIAAGLALTSTMGLGLSACGSDNANATPGSETTTSQSANNNSQTQTQDNNNSDTSANNANTDSQAEAFVRTFKINFFKSGFNLDSSDSDLLQSYKDNNGGIAANVEFTYNGTTYKGVVGTYDNKSYVVNFSDPKIGDLGDCSLDNLAQQIEQHDLQ